MTSHPIHFDDARCAGRWYGLEVHSQCLRCDRRVRPQKVGEPWINVPELMDGKCPQRIPQ